MRVFQKRNFGGLRRRINATKWPEKETVTDASQGVQLATMQALARYWATGYGWRKIEAKLNALPLIVTHGWPGSVIEQMKIIDPLTKPTASGASASDAFHAKHDRMHSNKVAKGGHFAAWEQPKLFSEELRAGFRSLR